MTENAAPISKHLIRTSIVLVSVAVQWLLWGSLAFAAPNVLFVVADDLNCAIEPYAAKDAFTAKTPHLKRLAARGVTFQRAYCQQAVCNPSRSSFLTGLRPDTVKVDDLRKYFRNTAPNGMTLVTLPQHFKNHGYYCQNIGKMFHNMGDTQDRVSWSIDESFFRGTHAADTVFANRPHEGQRPYKAPVTEFHGAPDTAYRDGQIARLAAEVIRDREGADRPFFLAVGFWRPHLPFVAPKKYWDLYSEQKIALPQPAAAPKNAPAIAIHASREIKGYGGVPKDRPFTEQEIRHYRHGYFAAISFLDAQLGIVLKALEETGQADNTIIVFTSDHGFHIGEHSMWGKTSNFELDARVPLIFADPRQPHNHGKKSKSLAELVDLFPTLAAAAGLNDKLPANLEGHDLTPVLKNVDATVKLAAFTQHQQPFYGSRKNWQAWGYSMRTARWRYTEWRDIDSRKLMARELYDHENDPAETMNLAGHADYHEAIRDLSEQLQHQQRDRVKP